MPQPQHTSRCSVQLPLSAAFENQTMTGAQNAHIFDPDDPIVSKPSVATLDVESGTARIAIDDQHHVFVSTSSGPGVDGVTGKDWRRAANSGAPPSP